MYNDEIQKLCIIKILLCGMSMGFYIPIYALTMYVLNKDVFIS